MSEPALVLHSQDLIYLLSGISYSASFLLAGDLEKYIFKLQSINPAPLKSFYALT